jgi:ribonuclease P protein subunit RPR2
MVRDTSNTQKFDRNRRESQKRKSQKILRKKKRKPSRYRKQNAILQKLALERIEYLMNTAIKIYSKNIELANRYVELARKYSMSSKVTIPKYKQLICHKCKKLMIPGISSRHRIQSRKKRGSRYVITCLKCNHSVHIFIKQKKTSST